jgi:uncharacterized protein with ParB-like and HNH nuclease domain
MAVALPETPTVGLGTFIEQNKFLVPSHQRDYSWDKSCCEQFLKDIENSMTKNDQIYFCGLMVFTKSDDNTLKVLDGQQRLATALMLFSAIRNWFRANKEAKLESQTEQKFLSNDDFGEEILDQKLRLNPANNDIFKKYVIDPSHFS